VGGTVEKAQLADHLRFFQELGVAGVSSDPRWRRRDSRIAAGERLAPAAGAVDPGVHEDEPDSGTMPIAVSRSPAEALAAIREHIGDCTRCKLHRLGRKQIVFGVGNPNADLMFVGEAPGADEDIQGIPFVGRAGQLLTKIIEAIGLSRDDVYIANVIKCRPPENRNPEPDEVESCEPFLFRQIDDIKPRVIVALGTFAAKALLKTQDPISRLRGRTYDYRGAKLIPTFHPAFLLRSPDRKRDVWEDMKRVRSLLNETDD
jgi:DNA polymerase